MALISGSQTITTANLTDLLDGGASALHSHAIADDSIVEAKFDVSNGPANDYFLQAQSGEGGGLTWAAAGGNLVLINESVVASNDADITVTGLGSTYDTYLILLSDLIPVTDSAAARLRLGDSASGIHTGGSDYQYHIQRGKDTYTTYGPTISSGASWIQFGAVGNATGEGYGAVLWLQQPGDATCRPLISGTHAFGEFTGELQGGAVVAARKAVITLDRVQFFFETGNITSGRMTVFGVKHG